MFEDIDYSIARIADNVRSFQRLLLMMRKATDIARQRGVQPYHQPSTFQHSDSWRLAKVWAAYYISGFETKEHSVGLTEDQLTSRVFDQAEVTTVVSNSHGGFDQLDFCLLSIAEGHVAAEPVCSDDADLGIA